MALTQADLDRILGRNPTAQDIFNANQPSVSAQRPSSPSLSAIANVMESIRKPLDAYEIKKNIPVVGGTTFADVTGLNQVAPLTQDVAYGRPVVRGGSLQTMQADPRLAGLVDFIPATGLAAKGGQIGAKAGAREIARQIETGTGIFGKGTIDPRMYAYLPDTPKSPNPEVGTRFVREDLNNLVPKIPVKIEDLQGASLKPIAWDSTNAEQLITSVSGEQLPSPVKTYGGQDFARAKHNVEANVGGASNKEIAKRIGTRIDTARQENLAKGGSGDIFYTPLTMSKGAENFSPMPTDVYLQLIKNNPDKKVIKELNEFLRTAPVQTQKGLVRPFKNFRGIETPEGQAQLYSGEGFDAKGTAGEFRKAFAKEMEKVRNQKAFGYNAKDVTSAVLDPNLMNLPRGMAGNTIIKATPEFSLSKSTHPAYDTDFSGNYFGSMANAPIEILMPKTYSSIYKQLESKYPNKHPEAIRQMTIGAIEKRNAGISELVDQQVIDNYYKYQEGLLGR
jgi:hypothetical protein